MNPIATESGFISRVVNPVGEIPRKIMVQMFWPGILREGLEWKLFSQNSNFPTFQVYINANVDVPAIKINFVTLCKFKSGFLKV